MSLHKWRAEFSSALTAPAPFPGYLFLSILEGGGWGSNTVSFIGGICITWVLFLAKRLRRIRASHNASQTFSGVWLSVCPPASLFPLDFPRASIH